MGYEMGTLSWIIQVRLKWNHKCPCKRKAEGDLTQAEKEVRGSQRHRLERCPTSQGYQQPAEAGMLKESGSVALPTPSFWPRDTDYGL